MSPRSKWVAGGIGGIALLFQFQIPVSSQIGPGLGDRRESQVDLNSGPQVGLLADAQVRGLLDRSNRYVKAVAIRELRRRKDVASRYQILELFEGTRPARFEVRFDPHGYSPGMAVLIAAGEYLAARDGASFFPALAARHEVQAVPEYFVEAFRALGPGWIRSAAYASDPAVGLHLIASGSSAPNLPEIEDFLIVERGPVWKAAARACARLGSPGCFARIESSIERQSLADRLTGQMILTDRSRADTAALFQAAAACAAASMQPDLAPSSRADLLMPLYEFTQFARHRSLQIPTPVHDLLIATGSRTLTSAAEADGGGK